MGGKKPFALLTDMLHCWFFRFTIFIFPFHWLPVESSNQAISYLGEPGHWQFRRAVVLHFGKYYLKDLSEPSALAVSSIAVSRFFSFLAVVWGLLHFPLNRRTVLKFLFIESEFALSCHWTFLLINLGSGSLFQLI